MYCDRDTFFLCNKNGLQDTDSIVFSMWGGAGGDGGGLNSGIGSECFSSESFMDLHLDTSLYSGYILYLHIGWMVAPPPPPALCDLLCQLLRHLSEFLEYIP